MTNCEKFNAMLNSCHNPTAIVEALLALAENGFFQKVQKEGVA